MSRRPEHVPHLAVALSTPAAADALEPNDPQLPLPPPNAPPRIVVSPSVNMT